MQIVKNKLSDDITLGLISPVLENIKFFDMSEKSTSSPEMKFHIFTLAPDVPSQIGVIALSSKFVQDNISLFTFYRRQNMLDGHIHEVQATVHYNNGNPLCAPRQWDYTVDMKDSLGESLKHMRLHKSAVSEHNAVIVKSSKTTRKLSIDGDFTINWLLFEAVRHLPKDTQKRYEFTMFDHFDQVKKDQLLYYSKSVEININGTDVVLHAFDHLGKGVVPWVYWVDEMGRLLFVVSGIEAYILNLRQLPKKAENNIW